MYVCSLYNFSCFDQILITLLIAVTLIKNESIYLYGLEVLGARWFQCLSSAINSDTSLFSNIQIGTCLFETAGYL